MHRTSPAVSVLLLALALAAGCQAASTFDGARVVEYRDRVEVTFPYPGPHRSLRLTNLGPGPVTVTLELRDGLSGSFEISEGHSDTYHLEEIAAVAFEHPDPLPARLEVDAPPKLASQLRITTDERCHANAR